MIFVGGEQEQVQTEEGKCLVVLRERFGFVKLAMKHGANLVPVYAWGENEAYHASNILLGFRRWLVKKFQIGLTFHYGSFYSPIIPLRGTVITIVYGKPMKVEKNENPTNEQIVDVLNRYIAEYEILFNSTTQYHIGKSKPVLEIQ